jgi:hypothetical protein
VYYCLGLYSKGGVDGFTRLALGSLHLGHACTHYPEPGVSDNERVLRFYAWKDLTPGTPSDSKNYIPFVSLLVSPPPSSDSVSLVLVKACVDLCQKGIRSEDIDGKGERRVEHLDPGRVKLCSKYMEGSMDETWRPCPLYKRNRQ